MSCSPALSHRPVVKQRSTSPFLTRWLALILALASVPVAARAGLDMALAVEHLNDGDRHCQLSDDAVRAAAVTGLAQQAVTLVDARTPYLIYLEAGGLPAGERCAYTLMVRLLHVERYQTPHPLFGESRASLLCSDGLRGLDAPEVGAERILEGLARIVAQCAAEVLARDEAGQRAAPDAAPRQPSRRSAAWLPGLQQRPVPDRVRVGAVLSSRS